jgi:hypothetical protein
VMQSIEAICDALIQNTGLCSRVAELGGRFDQSRAVVINTREEDFNHSTKKLRKN